MSNSVFGLEGKNALVIGGGQGMGEATVMQLANAGANVTVLDLEMSRAEAIAAKVKALGRKSWAVSANVLDDAALKAVIAKVDADNAHALEQRKVGGDRRDPSRKADDEMPSVIIERAEREFG